METNTSSHWKFFLIVLIVLTTSLYCVAQRKIDWDIYDQERNKIAHVSAKEISIAHDLIWYRSNQKYGVMDLHKNSLIRPKYESIHHYPNGMTAVRIGNCYGMVFHGKEILPLEYSNTFLVDSSGYIEAARGCSDNPEAYIISEHVIYDRSGKLIFQGCEEDVNVFFDEVTHRPKQQLYDIKRISNGFTIKLMPPDQKDVKKGIYNRKDSLIFSCVKCTISDNVNGVFFIRERAPDRLNDFETFLIDTLGRVKIKNGYDQLHYNPTVNFHLYTKGDEKGIIDNNGRVQPLAKTIIPNGVQVISGNRFLVSMSDPSGDVLSTICDSSGAYLLTPTKDNFQIIRNNCLVRKTQAGSIFIDEDGKPIFEPYDSVFVVPDFDYRKMVEGEDHPRFGYGPDVGSISPLERDGFSPVVKTPAFSHYGVVRGNKKGLFIIEKRVHVNPQYALVAKVTDNLFAAKKNGQWFVLNNQGELTFNEGSRYINFFEKYILVGN